MWQKNLLRVTSNTLLQLSFLKKNLINLISILWIIVLEDNLHLVLFKGWSGINWYKKAFLWLKELDHREFNLFVSEYIGNTCSL